MIPLARRLVRDFEVYAPDLPGFGKSEKPDRVLTIDELADFLALFVDELELDRVVLVGNSLGCEIIVALGINNPRRISRAVLQAPTIDPTRRTGVQQLLRLALDGLYEPVTLIPIVVLDYITAGPRRIIQTFRYMLNDPVEEKLPHVPFPTMVVRGGRDPVVSQAWVEAAVELLPCGRLVVLPGLAHAANYSQPGQLCDVILPFVERQF